MTTRTEDYRAAIVPKKHTSPSNTLQYMIQRHPDLPFMIQTTTLLAGTRWDGQSSHVDLDSEKVHLERWSEECASVPQSSLTLTSISHFTPSLNTTAITRPIPGPITMQSPETEDLNLESSLVLTSFIMSPEFVSKSTCLITPTMPPK